MIIYIFCNSDNSLRKTNLPIKISGVYQIHGKNNTFLGNFEEVEEHCILNQQLM